jgi:hypothetical protein
MTKRLTTFLVVRRHNKGKCSKLIPLLTIFRLVIKALNFEHKSAMRNFSRHKVTAGELTRISHKEK